VVWLLSWPQPTGPAGALLDEALDHLRQWRTSRWYADGTLETAAAAIVKARLAESLEAARELPQ
jgi:hypothetical protein